jgi:hypothetical protein
MARPPLEVADLVRAAGDAFLERNRHWLRCKHVQVLLVYCPVYNFTEQQPSFSPEAGWIRV